MSLGHSPTDPGEQSKPMTVVEKTAAVIIIVVLVLGALALVR
jgi:hypothetical protein